jgi:hypothetical protein
MTVGELRMLLNGIDDSLEVTIRTFADDGHSYCGGVSSVHQEYAHDDEETLFLAIDSHEEFTGEDEEE